MKSASRVFIHTYLYILHQLFTMISNTRSKWNICKCYETTDKQKNIYIYPNGSATKRKECFKLCTKFGPRFFFLCIVMSAHAEIQRKKNEKSPCNCKSKTRMKEFAFPFRMNLKYFSIFTHKFIHSFQHDKFNFFFHLSSLTHFTIRSMLSTFHHFWQ